MQYVFITGGVASSLGKGIASAALASLLQQRKFKVRISVRLNLIQSILWLTGNK